MHPVNGEINWDKSCFELYLERKKVLLMQLLLNLDCVSFKNKPYITFKL